MKRSLERQDIYNSLMTALTVIFGLQMLRVLLPTIMNYLRETRGMSAVSLAPIALGVFAVSFLAAPLRRLFGQRRALVIVVAGIALLRVIEQFSVIPVLDLLLASLGVALFTIFPAVALEVARPAGVRGSYEFGLAFLLGVAADTAIHSAAGTLDLTWREEPLAAFVVLLLAAAALIMLWLQARNVDLDFKSGRGWSLSLVVAAIGPWLFLQVIVFQNVARLAAIAGWSVPAAGLFIGAGNVIGLVAAAHAPRSKRVPGLTILVAVAFAAVMFFVEPRTTDPVLLPGLPNGLLYAMLSLAGQVLGSSLLMSILLTTGWLAERSGRLGVSAANGIGQMLFVIITFVFFISYELNFGFRSPAVLPVAALLIAVAAVVADRAMKGGGRVANNLVPAGIAALLLVLPFVLWLTWGSPEPVTPLADNTKVRVMDYNLHNGFNTDGRLDLEALAQVIEGENADVIGLQEVSRGWAIYGSVDMMEWLSHRLRLPYVYGPTESLQWGNAVLSRYPIIDDGAGQLPHRELRLRRGYIVADIDAGAGDFWVIATHLHHFEEDSQIRQDQVPTLLYAWDRAAHTVIMGDFNATPDAPEMVLLAEAGFLDAGALFGPDPGYTNPSADPTRRIDYFWSTQDLIPSNYEVGQTTASDHLPIAMTITIR
jgi:endonuclease/exonuclease/phosphatase family metal-dependent hydrolase